MIKFFILLFSFSVFSAPKEIEVWFISNEKVAELNKLLDRPYYVFKAKTAALQCQEMGEYCFDPQIGLYKKDDFGTSVSIDKALESDSPPIPTASSIDKDMINCDPKNYFDIFCGKAKKESPVKTKLDLWVDTSASMREFDFSDKEGGCHRKSLLKKLDRECGFNKKVNVMMFDTSIKQAGSIDQVCTNQGLNDQKRMIDWIERSNAPKLVIITDIYEFHKDFADYIESRHGTFKGEKTPLTGAQMVELADHLAKSCK